MSTCFMQPGPVPNSQASVVAQLGLAPPCCRRTDTFPPTLPKESCDLYVQFYESELSPVFEPLCKPECHLHRILLVDVCFLPAWHFPQHDGQVRSVITEDMHDAWTFHDNTFKHLVCFFSWAVKLGTSFYQPTKEVIQTDPRWAYYILQDVHSLLCVETTPFSVLATQAPHQGCCYSKASPQTFVCPFLWRVWHAWCLFSLANHSPFRREYQSL